MTHRDIFQPSLLAGKAAFITGGGSGINRQIAASYARAGAAVAIVGRDGEKARLAAHEIEAEGGRAMGLSADVRDAEALQQAAAAVHDALGRIDVVVAGAAGNFVCAADGMSANGFRAVIDTDLVGTFNTLKATRPFLRTPRWYLRFPLSSRPCQPTRRRTSAQQRPASTC